MGFSKYPSALDDSNSIVQAQDNVTPVAAEVFNRLRDAVLAVEAELGLDPSREYGTVRARLDAMSAKLNTIGMNIYFNGTLAKSNSQNINFTGNVNITQVGDTTIVEVLSSGGGAGDAVQEIISVTSNGQTAFTLGNIPSDVNDVQMYVNGIKIASSDYVIVDVNVTYSGALTLLTTDTLEFWYLIGGTGGGGGGGGGGGSGSVKEIRNVVGNSVLSISTDHVVFVDTTSFTSLITLPTGIDGKEYIIKDSGGNASSNNITVSSGQNIDGDSTYVINMDYGSVTVIFNSSEWSVV